MPRASASEPAPAAPAPAAAPPVDPLASLLADRAALQQRLKAAEARSVKAAAALALAEAALADAAAADDGDARGAVESRRKADDQHRFARAEIAGLKRRLVQQVADIRAAAEAAHQRRHAIVAAELERLDGLLLQAGLNVLGVAARARELHFAVDNIAAASACNSLTVPLHIVQIGNPMFQAAVHDAQLQDDGAIGEANRLRALIREAETVIADSQQVPADGVHI